MSNAPRPSGPADALDDAGFSLLELVVVMTILATVMAISLPRFGKPSQTAVQSMAVQLVAELRATRAEALRTNAEQIFMLELGQRLTWSLARPTPRRFVDGVNIEVTGSALEWFGDRAVQLRFQPTGAATGSDITVRDDRASAQSNVVRISVDWLTGVARIERAQ
jgi:prepilin-type N-terminal cleavage/methylation domain-containing protein